MSNKIVNSKHKIRTLPPEETPWILKDPPASPTVIKQLVARMTEIGGLELFGNFCYSAGGKIYNQKTGAPTGTRAAGAAANLVTEFMWNRVEDITDRQNAKPDINIINLITT